MLQGFVCLFALNDREPTLHNKLKYATPLEIKKAERTLL